ncbi:MAG: DUF3368 domain-containing protein [Verrucomicrobia bacterium]|nr:DUF3368 domain-containing protein [Verrucomicrobiota bacterium]
MIVVSDTSPITTLLQIERANLLKQIYGEVLIPQAVRDELSVLHPVLPDFFQCVQVRNRTEVDRLCKELDAGEAEAIVLAKEKHATVLLIDETEGRLIATREGIPIIGLLGVLIQAKKTGHITSLRNTLRELESRTTFRLSEQIKAVVFEKTGEN